jgi:hypothetical protein
MYRTVPRVLLPCLLVDKLPCIFGEEEPVSYLLLGPLIVVDSEVYMLYINIQKTFSFQFFKEARPGFRYQPSGDWCKRWETQSEPLEVSSCLCRCATLLQHLVGN